MGPRWAQKGLTRNGPSSQDNSWSPLGPILGPSSGQLGPFKPIIQPTSHPSCSRLALKTPIIPPNNHFANLFAAWMAVQTARTKMPMNQCTNPQALGVGASSLLVHPQLFGCLPLRLDDDTSVAHFALCAAEVLATPDGSHLDEYLLRRIWCLMHETYYR